MCMLTFFPAGAMPDVDALTNGAYVNDDGHGFAIVSGGEVLVEHGMSADDTIAEFARLRHLHPRGPALFHSRLCTHGAVGLPNCHPFRLGHDGRTVLAHNGILPSEVQPRAGDTRSDTRIAAEDFLPDEPFGSFGSQRGRERMAKWLGHYNKVVILTVNPRYRDNSYVINEEAGVWHDGTWYSNRDYLAHHSAATAASGAWWGDEGQYAHDESAGSTCVWCETVNDTRYWYCGECGACPDCGDVVDYCPCWGTAIASAPPTQRPSKVHR